MNKRTAEPVYRRRREREREREREKDNMDAE
jgi:hypothetical protein